MYKLDVEPALGIEIDCLLDGIKHRRVFSVLQVNCCRVADLPADGYEEYNAVDKEQINSQENSAVQIQEFAGNVDEVADHGFWLLSDGLAFEGRDALAPYGVGNINVVGGNGAICDLFHLYGISEVPPGGVADRRIKFSGFLSSLELPLGVVLLVASDGFYEGHAGRFRVPYVES